MQNYDVCFAWNWVYDHEFVQFLDRACLTRGLSLLQVTPHNLDTTLSAINEGQVEFEAFFDRASDTDDGFLRLVELANWHAGVYINRFSLARRAWDKAVMHARCVAAGLDAPKTIVLPAYNEDANPEPVDLSILGNKFAIKPAHGGGGMGVVVRASCWEDVLVARRQFPKDQYLLQEHVVPAQMEQRPAWFRVIYCAGEVHPCWWDPGTHIYTPLSEKPPYQLVYHRLGQIVEVIARICQLDLFSTEIAYTSTGQFLIVDYINDPIDLRLQSQTYQGVPDGVVQDVAEHLAGTMAERCMALPA